MFLGPYALANRLAHRLPLPDGKIRDSLRGRREAVARWMAWATEYRTGGPLVWVHGASVGEGLAAEPVTRRLRARRTDLQVVHSYSSPAAAHWPGSFGAEFANYLPPEEPDAIDTVLNCVAPTLVLFSRGDLWPLFTQRLLAREVPVAVIGGMVRPASLRLRAPIRWRLAGMHRGLRWVGAVATEDARRWARLGAPSDRIEVTGDPRHAQVLEREHRCAAASRLLEWANGKGLLVAGSTDPTDERIVLAAYSGLVRSIPGTRVIVAPHEPSPGRVRQVQQAAQRLDIEAAPWNGTGHIPGAPCLILDAMGVLADLYAASDIAYVGGGFHRAGVHAVAEPAAFAVPVLMGPRYEGSSDGRRLLAAGGAVALPVRDAHAVLHEVWRRWLHGVEERIAAGLAARATLDAGAARRTMEALLPLIGLH